MSTEPEYSDRYKILWFPREKKIVAEVRNYAVNGNSYRRIKIINDDALMRQYRMRFLLIEWEERPIIFASNKFMGLYQHIREAGIWHEVEHIHYEHCFNMPVTTQEELRKRRIEYINAGKVMPEEEEADAFTVKQIGKESLITFLQHVLATRPTGADNSLNEMGRKELVNRIKMIQDS